MSSWLYIDDAEEADIRKYTDALETAAADLGFELEIEIRKPPPDVRIDELVAELKVDGVLLDVELDKAVDDADRPYPITGTALAQNIRDLQNAGRVPELPLVRLSQRDVIRRYVGKDHSSLDLFDLYLDKADTRTRAPQFAEQLVALDAGYRRIGEIGRIDRQSIPALIGIDPAAFENLNASLQLHFLGHSEAPAHDFSRFVTQALLARDGPLIGERSLGARLGIDIDNSKQAWPEVIKALEPVLYSGIFAIRSDPRWWADGVASWWSELDPDHRLLANETGEERCGSIANHLNLEGLRPIADDPDSPGPYYWTLCVESGRPVDPMNAYAITPDATQREWHDIRYMSREEAFQRARDSRFDAAEQARILDDRGLMNAGR